MRLSVRPGMLIIFPPDFQGPSRAHRTPQKLRCFPGRATLAPGNLISGYRPVKKEKRTLPRARAGVSGFTCVAALDPSPDAGILTCFPFDRRRNTRMRPVETEFPYLLGSVHPCPNTVHMEPFSTSVFKLFI